MFGRTVQWIGPPMMSELCSIPGKFVIRDGKITLRDLTAFFTIDGYFPEVSLLIIFIKSKNIIFSLFPLLVFVTFSIVSQEIDEFAIGRPLNV